MKLAFVVCVLTLTLHGCSNVPPKPSQPLHDGRWGEYNYLMAEQCAIQALIEGIDSAEITKLFNNCVLEQGLTI